mgnify:CR=1 FL=1
MNRKLARLTRPDRDATFWPVDTVRRLAVLFLIAISLLLPGGTPPAQAMPIHGVSAMQADCPHAAATQPRAGSQGHLPAVMAQCCYALPMTAEVLGAAPLRQPVPDAILRPVSDTMPAPLAVGPDLPPPRA